jgi:hypothetical protein
MCRNGADFRPGDSSKPKTDSNRAASFGWQNAPFIPSRARHCAYLEEALARDTPQAESCDIPKIDVIVDF